MKVRKRIILVDDQMTSLAIGKEVLGNHFDVLTVPSGEKLFQALDLFGPDLILLDVDMPEMDGFQILRTLKYGHKTADIPIIFLSGCEDPDSHARGLRLGAADFVVKPYTPTLLVHLVKRHLLLAAQRKQIRHYEDVVRQTATEQCAPLFGLQDSILDTLVFLSENKNHIFGMPGAGTLRGYLSAMIGEMHRSGIYRSELSVWNDASFIISAQLHDIGKIIVRDAILQKPGKLTAEEFEAVKHHTIFGVKVIERIERDKGQMLFLDNAKLFAGTHHERWDGSGYPLGLREQAIPLQGRILAIADVYDALVSERPYKRPLSHEAARKIILDSKGTHFDPLLTEVFMSVSDQFAEIKNGSRTGII